MDDQHAADQASRTDRQQPALRTITPRRVVGQLLLRAVAAVDEELHTRLGVVADHAVKARPVSQPSSSTTAEWIRMLGLPGRGHTRVWEHPGPPGAPTLMLVHGVTLNAALNWSALLETLGTRSHVIAMDLCGHGESFHAGAPFSLEDCADDLAQLTRIRGVEQMIAVGYSIGGVIAQLLYRRHRDLVAGLVLCGTARNFRGSLFERIGALMLPAAGPVRIRHRQRGQPARDASRGDVAGTETDLGDAQLLHVPSQHVPRPIETLEADDARFPTPECS